MMAKRGPKNKYSTEKVQQFEQGQGLSEHRLHLLPARKYDPSSGTDENGGGIYSKLTEMCSGDWSDQSQRYVRDPGISLTREEIDVWVAEGMPRLRQETPERIAQLEAQMCTWGGIVR
jgi:hypothetical protein